MTNDDIKSLAIGAVIVLAGYFIYQRLKAAPAAAQPAKPYTPPPRQWNLMEDLLTGVVHDIGSFNGQNYLYEMETDDGKYLPMIPMGGR